MGCNYPHHSGTPSGLKAQMDAMRPKKIWACWSLYNEAELIEKSILSVYGLGIVDKYIFVDGNFPYYPGPPVSTDGQNEKVKELVDRLRLDGRLVTHVTQWSSQMEKRSAYLNMIPTNDWVLIVDGDWQIYMLTETMARVQSALSCDDVDGFQPRVVQACADKVYDIRWTNPLLFRKAPGLHYEYNHYSLYDSLGRFFGGLPYRFERLNGMVVYHVPRGVARDLAWFDRDLLFKNERANGNEPIWCQICELTFQLNIGDPFICPKCGQGAFWCKPVEDKK